MEIIIHPSQPGFDCGNDKYQQCPYRGLQNCKFVQLVTPCPHPTPVFPIKGFEVIVPVYT